MLWGNYINTDTLQFGLKQGASTTQSTWLVNEVTNYFMRRGTPVSACLLDCCKAFHKCRFAVLFKKLMNKGLPPIVIRLLVFVYEEQYGCVKLGGKRSDQFQISNGTRQNQCCHHFYSRSIWIVYY